MERDFLITYLRLPMLLFVVHSLGCHPYQNSAIERGTAAFRESFNLGKYQDIYAHSDAELRGKATEVDFIRVLQLVHDRLGKAGHSQLVNFQQGWFTGRGAIVTAVYDTQFARGNGTETFVWKIVNDEALLVGYHVASDLLDDAKD